MAEAAERTAAGLATRMAGAAEGAHLGPNLVPMRSFLGAQKLPRIAPGAAPEGTQGELKWYQDGFSGL